MNDGSDERLVEIQQELADILEARLSALTQSLRKTEILSRRIIQAEIALAQHQRRQQEQAELFSSLQRELDQCQAQHASVQSQYDDLVGERDDQLRQTDELEKDNARIRSEITQIRTELTRLEGTRGSLDQEHQSQVKKQRALHAHISRMVAQKENLSYTISDLEAQMRQLTRPNEER